MAVDRGQNNGFNMKIVAGAAVALIGGFLLLRPAGTDGGAAQAGKRCPTMGVLRQRTLAKGRASANVYRDPSIKHSERVAAVGQKGATIWMTGLSGSGKSTIGRALERRLVLDDSIHMYRLDGDNLRFGLSRDLGLTSEDRMEQIRRAYEVSSLFADSGSVSLVSLISPFRADRDDARELHDKMGLPFLEVFVDVPVSVAEDRDPKGLYKRFRKGEIKGFTGIDAPYEAPLRPEITLKTGTCCGHTSAEQALATCKQSMPKGEKADKACRQQVDGCIDACVDTFRTELISRGVITPKGAKTSVQPLAQPKPAVASFGPPGPHKVVGHADGYAPGTTSPSVVYDDEEYWVSDEVTRLQPVKLRDVDVQWMQVVGEGWAAPIRGPMRESALVQTLHFNSLLVDTDDRTGVAGTSGHGSGPKGTDFGDTETASKMAQMGDRVSSPVPIILPVCKQTKMLIKRAAARAVAAGEKPQVLLVSPAGEPVAVLNDPEVYDFRKEELIARHWGSWDPEHPYVKDLITPAHDFLLGGEIFRCRRIRFRDGLDQWRLTPQELLKEFESRGADGVFAFQTRNPTHAGHAHLMKDGRRQLIDRGFKNPVLWLSPLGGWTKSDDAPLDVRVRQHQAVLDERMLDPAWTVLAIWPSPMVYSGPTEVQWHAKSRRVVGADYFIVGRDPAGLPYSDAYAKAHNQSKADDVYEPDHGRYVLQMSPGIGSMGFLASGAVHYDKTDGEMKPKPAGMSKSEFGKRFLKISGSKMRQMGRMGVDVCESMEAIPSDWSDSPACVPPKFMVRSGWKIMREYYQTREDPVVKANAIMQSKQRPQVAANARMENATKVGIPGNQFGVYLVGESGQRISPWHDVPLKSGDSYNMVVEIPKGTNSKFEVQKNLPHNPIKQDIKKELPRHYTYGMAFFNNGLFPQTWEDSTQRDEAGHAGDNDPLDVMEVGRRSYPIGSIVRVKVLGTLALIDEGETDHKIIVIAQDDPDAAQISDIASLRSVKGQAFVDRIVDWLRNYKTTDKKDPDTAEKNTFANNGEYGSVSDAERVIAETNKRWKLLQNGAIEQSDKTRGFWLGARD
eukprot:TRINITY_DN679_c0_g1_i1.p1 TRINITY_DN679_c0_g1~~TRINITY_DN679_c0_g1_i1.p1  ORF type:complete len:1111 (+),score=380.75 TRINITY_DN679_c0_g1_i1:115-3333(+)